MATVSQLILGTSAASPGPHHLPSTLSFASWTVTLLGGTYDSGGYLGRVSASECLRVRNGSASCAGLVEVVCWRVRGTDGFLGFCGRCLPSRNELTEIIGTKMPFRKVSVQHTCSTLALIYDIDGVIPGLPSTNGWEKAEAKRRFE